jgi:uncharacterized protein
MYEKIRALVEKIMPAGYGHGMDHIDRVYGYAMRISDVEGGDREIIALAALLHDADDYKLFGEESEKNLTNAMRIMNECGIPLEIQMAVKETISTMGYSRLLAGIRPKTLEGKIVSDADMVDGGATGIVRTIEASAKNGRPFFDRNSWPNPDASAQEYRKIMPNVPTVHHFFNKILKLKNIVFTESAKKIAEENHEFYVLFLRHFFKENNALEWNDYMDNFLKKNAI